MAVLDLFDGYYKSNDEMRFEMNTVTTYLQVACCIEERAYVNTEDTSTTLTFGFLLTVKYTSQWDTAVGSLPRVFSIFLFTYSERAGVKSMLSPVITTGAFTAMWSGLFAVMARVANDGTGEKAEHDARTDTRTREVVRMVEILLL